MNLHGNQREATKALFATAIVVFSLSAYWLLQYIVFFQDFESLLLQDQFEWLFFACIAVWSVVLILLTFRPADIPLLLFITAAVEKFAIDYGAAVQSLNALVLLSGIAAGRAVLINLSRQYQRKFINVLILILSLSFCCHLDVPSSLYHGPRWTGLWINPNAYGMIMSAGFLLAFAFFLDSINGQNEDGFGFAPSFMKFPKSWEKRSHLIGLTKLVSIIYFLELVVLGVGLFLSYSRGAWCGTLVGLLYVLGKSKKLNWRFIFPGFTALAVLAWMFWGMTSDHSVWYIKRLDLGRLSAQNRVWSWGRAIHMVWDHPLGVGWNNAIVTYHQHYSPPNNGTAALLTNDYLMIGTELGLYALLCFIAYLWLAFRPSRPYPEVDIAVVFTEQATMSACRGATISLLVSFWFDGGIFELPTAVLFWVLLEVGKAIGFEKGVKIT